jgi:TRAP transporter 4TM/12TM fusion protein
MAKPRALGLSFWFSVGARRRPSGWLRFVVPPLAVALAIYVIVAATALIVAPWALTAIFLCGMMTIAFLVTGATPDSDPEKPSILDYAFSLGSLATGVYFFINRQEFIDRIALLSELSNLDVFFGVLMVVLTIEITRRSTGLGLTAVVLVFIAYNLYGHNLSGVLKHGYIDYIHFVDIMIFTTDGVMGLPARVAATYAFMFVLFGTLLYYAKGADFFYDFAASISGGKTGGPAKVAVISSGLYGMISGSPTSDVVTTGSVTIPIMKRLGYRPAVAGAIEVAASTGGSIMPPVLGSAAFLMAEYTGIDYKDIAIAAILPALLYYTGVYAQVHFRARRLGLGGIDPAQLPKLLPTLRKGGMFAVPLVVLTWALLDGYTPTMVAVFGSLAVIAVSFLRRETCLNPLKLWNALAETTYRMVAVAGATAAAGLVIAGITMTGLAAKFAHVIYGITSKDQLLTMTVAGALCLILGLGMPTPSAYILAAVLIGPLMNEIGVNVLAGHLFLLYFAVMSALTPPVAVAAYAASAIAEDNPMTIAVHAVKLALAAFCVPFVFVIGPELLWQGPLWLTAVTFVTAAVAIVLLAAAIERYEPLADAWWARLILAVGAIFLLVPHLWAAGVGIAVCALAFGLNTLARNRARAGA